MKQYDARVIVEHCKIYCPLNGCDYFTDFAEGKHEIKATMKAHLRKDHSQQEATQWHKVHAHDAVKKTVT